MAIYKKLVWLILLILFNACVAFDFYQLEYGKEIDHFSFWLKKIEDPDKEVLTQSEIKRLNKKIDKQKYTGRPLLETSKKKGSTLKNILLHDLRWMQRLKKYDINNVRLRNKKFNSEIYRILDLEKIPRTVRTRFCLVTKPTYLRAFPTDSIIMTKPDDMPFDILQKSFLDTGEPMALYHTSRDGQWGFIFSTHSHGWVRLKHIAWTYNRNIVKDYIHTPDFVLALDWKVPVYTSNGLPSIIHMGTKVPLIEKNDDYIVVRIPYRDSKGRLHFKKGYIKDNEAEGALQASWYPKGGAISFNYLKMTPRNIAQQSFKMLGEPYSWGGKNFNTDCSYFIKVVFQTMGLNLPRNSYGQVKSLKNFKTYNKNKIYLLNSLKPFQALLYNSQPSHIMLYIGKIDDQYYVIHNKWSYKRLNGDEEEEVFLKKTLISALSLGRDSMKGSLLKNISYIGVLKL